VGGGRDERTGPDEVVEQRLGERRALGRVGAGAELVEEDERAGPAASTIRVIERRWPENVDRLWAIDCSSPMSAKTSRKTGRREPASAGMCRPAWCMSASRPSVRRRDGLAAVFGPGDDQRREAVAEPDVDRHDASREAGVAGAEEDDLRARRRLGAGPVHVGRETRLRGPEVEAGERRQRLPERGGVGRDQRGQLVEDPLDLLPLRDLRLAPGVAELDAISGSTKSVEPLPDVSWTMPLTRDLASALTGTT
jgi:hypothetical protein